MKLRRPCIHDRYEMHAQVRFEHGVMMEDYDCPGGEFLPEDALVIEKDGAEWSEWALGALSYVQMNPTDLLNRLASANPSLRQQRLTRQFKDQPGSFAADQVGEPG